MKKELVAIFCMLMFVSGFAGIKSEVAMGYKIIKDTADASVKSGTCLVSGTVIRDGENVSNALVYSQHSRGVKTNAKGEFRILLDIADQYLTVTKSGNLQGFIEGYKFKGGHAITCEVYLYDMNEILIVDKPVIYLYAEEEIEVDLWLQTDMDLTFTYPLLDEAKKWEVNVGANGIYTQNGQSYPYLFWEAETNDLTYKKEEEVLVGDFVSTDTVVSYLEHKLTALGLNSVERTDFITYWGPRMVRYNFVVAQFNLDELVDEMAHLEVVPTPDAQRRVFLLFTGFEYDPGLDIVPPKEPASFKRNGFTLFEWGGTEVSKGQLLKTL